MIVQWELAIDAQEQGADGIIITGFSTGIAPTKEKVIEAKRNSFTDNFGKWY